MFLKIIPQDDGSYALFYSDRIKHSQVVAYDSSGEKLLSTSVRLAILFLIYRASQTDEKSWCFNPAMIVSKYWTIPGPNDKVGLEAENYNSKFISAVQKRKDAPVSSFTPRKKPSALVYEKDAPPTVQDASLRSSGSSALDLDTPFKTSPSDLVRLGGTVTLRTEEDGDSARTQRHILSCSMPATQPGGFLAGINPIPRRRAVVNSAVDGGGQRDNGAAHSGWMTRSQAAAKRRDGGAS